MKSTDTFGYCFLGWKFKIRECLGPYCEQLSLTFFIQRLQTFFILVTFFTFFNVFYFNLNVFYIYGVTIVARVNPIFLLRERAQDWWGGVWGVRGPGLRKVIFWNSTRSLHFGVLVSFVLS